jgi:hypothetical protein
MTHVIYAREEYYPGIFLEGLRKTTKNLRIAGLMVEI